MEKEHNLKQNFLILFLCLVLLGLINIFYIGLGGRKSGQELMNGPSSLSDEQIENIGKGVDLKYSPKDLSDKQIENIGKGVDLKYSPKDLTDEQIENIGR